MPILFIQTIVSKILVLTRLRSKKVKKYKIFYYNFFFISEDFPIKLQSKLKTWKNLKYVIKSIKKYFHCNQSFCSLLLFLNLNCNFSLSQFKLMPYGPLANWHNFTSSVNYNLV